MGVPFANSAPAGSGNVAKTITPSGFLFYMPVGIVNIPDIFDPQCYNRYSYCVNNPLRFADPSGHGPLDDALFNTGLLKDSYQLMMMKDSLGWKVVEVSAAAGAMIVGTADAVFNVATLGIKGAIKGGIKQLIKAGAETSAKEAPHLIQDSAKVGAEREAKTISKLEAEKSADEVVQGQRTLRDANGKKVVDPVTGEGRRVDHAVIDRKNNMAKTYETTGTSVDKRLQLQKEDRIRAQGGTYIRDKETRQLVPVQGTSEVIRHP